MTNKFPEMMENFDIDKLKQINIYKAPDFFEEMQEDVLQKTIFSITPATKVVTPGRKSYKTWFYSAAATVAIVFGTVFSFDKKEEADTLTVNLSQNKIPHPPRRPEPVYGHTATKPQTKTELANAGSVKTVEKPRLKKHLSENSVQKSLAAINYTYKDDKIDEVLSVIPKNELAEISNDAEADIYLDLYN